MLNVFGHEIAGGEKAYFSLPVGQTSHQGIIQFPVIVATGVKEGPVLWINGTVHGDELNGSYGAWKLVRELDLNKLKGTVIVTPVCNPPAFESRSKVSIMDGMDMDTAFPGDPEGMISQRIAYILYKEIKEHANALISFHTMATPYRANPYSVRKILAGVSDDVNRIAEGMQRAFGVVTNCVVDLTKPTSELPGVTSGALDITCLKDGIPAFMGEMGQGGKIEDCYVDTATCGIQNVMIYLNMLDGEIVRPERQVKITARKFLRSDLGGLMRATVQPGDIVKEGGSLLDLHYYNDKIEHYYVKQDSYIIGIRENPVVYTGERIAFVGTKWEDWE